MPSPEKALKPFQTHTDCCRVPGRQRRVVQREAGLTWVLTCPSCVYRLRAPQTGFAWKEAYGPVTVPNPFLSSMPLGRPQLRGNPSPASRYSRPRVSSTRQLPLSRCSAGSGEVGARSPPRARSLTVAHGQGDAPAAVQVAGVGAGEARAQDHAGQAAQRPPARGCRREHRFT